MTSSKVPEHYRDAFEFLVSLDHNVDPEHRGALLEGHRSNQRDLLALGFKYLGDVNTELDHLYDEDYDGGSEQTDLVYRFAAAASACFDAVRAIEAVYPRVR